MAIEVTVPLGSLLNFSNGKSSPERSDDGPFAVFGSNGIIGRASENNAGGSTIVIGRVGTYCGSLHYSPTACWVTDNAIKAVARDDNNPLYLFYLMGTLRLNDRRAGSGQPLLNQQILSNIAVLAPRPAEQSAIAAILSALDDKIELNWRVNETLEASARALFKDWFVDFGPTRAKAEGRPAWLAPDLWSLFPDRLGDDGVPEGWSAYTLGELAHQHTGSIDPAKGGDELFEHYSLPAFDNGASPSLDRGDTIKSNKTLLPPGVVLLSKLNPEIPRVWMPAPAKDAKQVASTEFLAFVPKAPAGRTLLFAMFRDATFRQIMEGMVTGTSKSHQRISPPALRAVSALTGAPAIFDAFERLASPMMERMLANRIASRTLATTRDALLPKLMSGEIHVREAETLAA